jgi:hypothetical protein
MMKKDIQIKRVEEELTEQKENKHFLDVLSIQAGLKKYSPL